MGLRDQNKGKGISGPRIYHVTTLNNLNPSAERSQNGKIALHFTERPLTTVVTLIHVLMNDSWSPWKYEPGQMIRTFLKTPVVFSGFSRGVGRIFPEVRPTFSTSSLFFFVGEINGNCSKTLLIPFGDSRTRIKKMKSAMIYWLQGQWGGVRARYCAPVHSCAVKWSRETKGKTYVDRLFTSRHQHRRTGRGVTLIFLGSKRKFGQSQLL